MIRTAICKDAFGDAHPVHCNVTSSVIDAEQQIAKDHPDLKFDGWVYDLRNEDDRNTARLYFLSPNVWGKRLWVRSDRGFESKMVERQEVQ